MRICIPTHGDEGLGAAVDAHLGRAPFLTLVDTESGELTVVANAPHRDGQCQPAAPLDGHGVEAVVCSGAGRRAVATLAAAGIRVLTTQAGRVDGVLESFRAGGLRELSPGEACVGHRREACHDRS